MENTKDLLTEFAMKSFNQKRGMAECMAMEFMFELGQAKKDLIAGVVGSEERTELVCGFCGTNKAEVCFKCHTNECVSASGQN